MNDIMASSDLSSLGNFAALTGTSTSWVSQGTVTIRPALPFSMQRSVWCGSVIQFSGCFLWFHLS